MIHQMKQSALSMVNKYKQQVDERYLSLIENEHYSTAATASSPKVKESISFKPKNLVGNVLLISVSMKNIELTLDILQSGSMKIDPNSILSPIKHERPQHQPTSSISSSTSSTSSSPSSVLRRIFSVSSMSKGILPSSSSMNETTTALPVQGTSDTHATIIPLSKVDYLNVFVSSSSSKATTDVDIIVLVVDLADETTVDKSLELFNNLVNQYKDKAIFIRFVNGDIIAPVWVKKLDERRNDTRLIFANQVAIAREDSISRNSPDDGATSVTSDESEQMDQEHDIYAETPNLFLDLENRSKKLANHLGENCYWHFSEDSTRAEELQYLMWALANAHLKVALLHTGFL